MNMDLSCSHGKQNVNSKFTPMGTQFHQFHRFTIDVNTEALVKTTANEKKKKKEEKKNEKKKVAFGMLSCMSRIAPAIVRAAPRTQQVLNKQKRSFGVIV